MRNLDSNSTATLWLTHQAFPELDSWPREAFTTYQPMALTLAHLSILAAAAVALDSAYTMGFFGRNRMPVDGKVRNGRAVKGPIGSLGMAGRC